MGERKAGRELDALVAERVMGQSLSVERERAMAIVGASYVRVTGPVFTLDVHGYELKVHMPPGEDIDDRWKLRSRTFEGLADAMAAQWGAIESEAAA